MTAPKKKPAASADLTTRMQAGAAELAAARDVAAALVQDLGAAMVSDPAAAPAIQDKLADANARVDRLQVGAGAFASAVQAAKQAEEAARIAGLKDEMNAELAASDKDFHAIAAGAAALRKPADDAHAHMKRALTLSFQIDPPPAGVVDRRTRPVWPEGLLKDVLLSALGRTWGGAVSDKRGNESAERLLALCSSLVEAEGK